MRYSVITPTAGARPKALAAMARSVAAAAKAAGLGPDQVELLIGFDGVEADCPEAEGIAVTCTRFRKSGDFGNAVRHGLIKMARGARLLFVDDDNALTPEAFTAYASAPEADFVVGRIDCSRAFDIPELPIVEEGQELVRQYNIDPLCLCLSRELVWERCGGWTSEGGYESDLVNIFRYHRRARRVALLDAVVGVYDAGAGLDPRGANPRQKKRLQGG